MSAPDPGSTPTDADRLRYEIGELLSTARALSSERDIRKLLGLILRKCREVTGSDAGSVYVLEGEGPVAGKRLHFMLSQNDSLAIDFQEFTLGVDARSIVGKAVLDARPINIPDLEALDQPGANPWGVRHDRSFDEKTGYRARSMLTVPLLSAHGEVIGVVQLINRKRDPRRALLGDADVAREVVPFDERSEELALALAAQAGLSLENAILYDEIRNVFEGFVDASVTAIESRDPTTSGHSRRVATLTVELARRVDGLAAGPLGGIRFDAEQLRQMEYAGMLHDFGKVGVRERVLVKPKKLHDEDLRAIRLRFAYVRKAQQVDALEAKLRLVEGPRDGGVAARIGAIDRELAGRAATLDELARLIEHANEPSVVEQGGLDRLAELARLTYRDAAGDERPILEPDELAALQIRRGSLTPDERAEIESHVVHTYNFLRKIPWGRSLRDLPAIAGAHHEYLTGTGYPAHLAAGAIRIETRMMTIADIFDALTASDRPYKRAVPIERALGIIDAEVRAGKIDRDLFDVFVGAQVYTCIL